MISIDVIQRSVQMLLPDLDGCYWVISFCKNAQLRLIYHENCSSDKKGLNE
ncbi:hypothetical protein G3820_005151 [Escherichia coli]|nr:hypothetical protein [Escherichia coli]